MIPAVHSYSSHYDSLIPSRLECNGFSEDRELSRACLLCIMILNAFKCLMQIRERSIINSFNLYWKSISGEHSSLPTEPEVYHLKTSYLRHWFCSHSCMAGWVKLFVWNGEILDFILQNMSEQNFIFQSVLFILNVIYTCTLICSEL